MQIQPIAVHLLTQILQESGPEKAAKLKQRLIVAFAEKGLGRFDEKALGYLKFKDFLEGALGGLVNIDRDNSEGDIVVSLKAGGIMPEVRVSSLPVVRNDVWQAFSNPDLDRRRFFNLSDNSIIHFKRGEDGDKEAKIASSKDFLEINPVSGHKQLTWMKDFLESLQLPEDQRSALQAIPKEPYSSGLNLTFTRALGGYADSWRRYRRDRIFAEVQDWAGKNNFSTDVLLLQHRKGEEHQKISGQQTSLSASIREQAIHLLALLSEEDIAKAVIPTIVTTILLRSRT